MPDKPPTSSGSKPALSYQPRLARASRWAALRSWWPFDRRWAAETFSREQIISSLKTLAWVAPLTFLIWIYAEREQVAHGRNETIPFELRCVDPDKLVTLKPPQDSNVVIDFEGPRARVEQVLQRLRGGGQMRGLEVLVDPKNAGREYQVPIGTLVANNDMFKQNGITVTRCQPERVVVLVDQIVERDAKVLPPPTVTNLEAATTFEPAIVKLTGPQSVLDEAERRMGRNNLVVYARLQDRPELKTPGIVELRNIPIELPRELQDDRINASQTRVRATLHVRSQDAEWTMDSMAVRLDAPHGFEKQYTVEYEASLPKVTLIGPRDKIEMLQQSQDERPYALLKVSSADVGESRRRRPWFSPLPDGVRISDADRQREIRFEVTAKAADAQ
jgi:hypothetical protein